MPLSAVRGSPPPPFLAYTRRSPSGDHEGKYSSVRLCVSRTGWMPRGDFSLGTA